jgi:putative ABC transport system ATP-binding protein
MVSELIRYQDVGVRFNGCQLLSGFNLNINQGDKILLKGKSGTGKSTLLKLILGIVRVQEGKVYFRGQGLCPETVWNIRKEIAYVSQDTDIGEGIVKDLINEIFHYQNNKGMKYHNKRNYLLEYFEMDKALLYNRFEDLSGGEKQRICLIISILLGKEIFLLDEVTSALDFELKKKVVDYFLQQNNWTLFIASHDDVWDREETTTIYVGEGDQCGR